MRRALLDLTGLRLHPKLWDERLELIDRLGAALDTDDLDTADRLLVTLEMLSGDRVDRIAAPGSVPAPDKVRERVSMLVHPPQAAAQAGTEPADQQGGQTDDGRRRPDAKR